MAQPIRERVPEFAILKTIGFSDGKSPTAARHSRRFCWQRLYASRSVWYQL